MDRELSVEMKRARWWRLNRAWLIVLTGAVLLALLGMRYLTPSLSREALSIAVVERGPIQAIVAATGTVVPISQHTISSPVAAEIRQVFVALGERVTQGQKLLELDTTAAELALSNAKEELALKRQELRSTDLQLADAVRQSRSKRDLLAIDLEANSARLQRLEQLGESGIVSKQELLEARLGVKRTRVELEQIEAQMKNDAARRNAELEQLNLACSMLEKKVSDQARRVALTSVAAPRAGVVTLIADQVGSSVSEGQVLVTVSGEEAFRVEATLSDFYAAQVRPGQRVNVQLSPTQTLSAHLARIVPSSVESQITVFIDLDNPSAPGLRANSRVNAEIVTVEKASGLRVRRGTSFEAGGVQDVYVLRGRSAVRTKVRTGLSSSQMIEIVDGLSPGDQVILSDMTDYTAPEIQVLQN
jgi:HlyD family secretion protein